MYEFHTNTLAIKKPQLTKNAEVKRRLHHNYIAIYFLIKRFWVIKA